MAVKSNRMVWMVSIIAITAIALIYNHNKTEEIQSIIIPIEDTITTKNIDVKNERPDSTTLVSRWKRSDGGYVIEIRKAAANGKLEVSYFNPNPIKVGRALWATKDNRLIVLVELNDVNYPGSTYGLEYVEKEDKLYGKYFQAVEKKTYDVDFIREK